MRRISFAMVGVTSPLHSKSVLGCFAGGYNEQKTMTEECHLNSSKRVIWAMPNCFDDIPFVFFQPGKLLMQRTYHLWIGEGVTSSEATAFNCGVKPGAKNDVVKR